MKRKLSSLFNSHNKKVACTVSAAALMLGVSSAGTIGLHFQCSYGCGAYPSYSGYPVSLTAFGVDPSHWENLLQTPSGYQNCTFVAPGYETNEIIDTETSTNGLNPLPNGSIDVTWFANCANFDPFFAYGGSPPYYTGGGPLNTNSPTLTGEMEIYATFLRDGINFGPNTSGTPAPYGSADNPLQAYWSIDITGLNTLFTNTPFVAEVMASADSLNRLTNVFLTDVSNGITNSVDYPNMPPPNPQGGAPWLRGIGGGLSSGSGVFSNVSHLHIASAIPQHGTNGTPNGYDNAGTICGFILTDKPVVSMAPRSIPVAGPGDAILLNPYAIGVPPLAYQWRLNGQNIAGATSSSYTIASVSAASGGSYDLVVTNLYGATTSAVSLVTLDKITQGSASNVVYDSNPDNAEQSGINMGATWEASDTDGTVTRTGVMSFNGAETNGITVAEAPALSTPTGTITFWMKSPSAPSSTGASILTLPNGQQSDDFIIYQATSGDLEFQSTESVNYFSSTHNVSNDKWHFVAITFDQTTNGGAAIYIDGALDTTNSNFGLSWSWPSGKPIEVGYSTDSDWTNYTGSLDGVRYYSAILSPSEISSIYTSGNADAQIDPADLQLEFNFSTPPGSGIILNWAEGSAVLQSAPSLEGPWTDLPGAVSPYTIVPAESQQFFRYKYAPQSLVSNPFLM